MRRELFVVTCNRPGRSLATSPMTYDVAPGCVKGMGKDKALEPLRDDDPDLKLLRVNIPISNQRPSLPGHASRSTPCYAAQLWCQADNLQNASKVQSWPPGGMSRLAPPVLLEACSGEMGESVQTSSSGSPRYSAVLPVQSVCYFFPRGNSNRDSPGSP